MDNHVYFTVLLHSTQQIFATCQNDVNRVNIETFCEFYFYMRDACICAENTLRVFIHFIFLGSWVRLGHEDGLFLQDPLSVHFDNLPGC